MRPTRCAAIALLALMACRREAPASARAADSLVPPPGIRALVAMAVIDSVVQGLKPAEVIEPAEGTAQPRKLTLWKVDGRPVKLVVTEPNELGQMTGKSAWYFQGDTIVAAQGPRAGYAFDRGQLVEWMDETGTVAETNPDALRSRDAELKKGAARWLAAF